MGGGVKLIITWGKLLLLLLLVLFYFLIIKKVPIENHPFNLHALF